MIDSCSICNTLTFCNELNVLKCLNMPAQLKQNDHDAEIVM
jgi:hypothetical protein